MLPIKECALKFGSWTYDGFELDVRLEHDSQQIDIADYVKSNEWALIDSPARRNVRYHPCCGDMPFPDVTFIVRLRRVSIYYNYILILPCSLLSVLTLVVFWLPPESPAKMLLGRCRGLRLTAVSCHDVDARFRLMSLLFVDLFVNSCFSVHIAMVLHSD